MKQKQARTVQPQWQVGRDAKVVTGIKGTCFRQF